MSKLWEAIKDLERDRERDVVIGDDPPRELSGERERRNDYLEGIRGKWRRHATAEDEQ